MTTFKIQSSSAVLDYKAGIVDLLQAEIGFTCDTDPCPIIATGSLFSCVAIFGCEASLKLGFGGHFHSVEHIQKCFNKVIEVLKLLTRDKPAHFAVYIAGGEIDKSEPMVLCAREVIALSPIKMTVVKMNVLKKEGEESASVALDTRISAFFLYNENKNPRNRNKEYLAHMRNFVLPMTGKAGKTEQKEDLSPPDVKIAYLPYKIVKKSIKPHVECVKV